MSERREGSPQDAVTKGPLMKPPAQVLPFTDRAANRWLIGGRLQSGVSTAQAAAEMDVIGRTLELEYPGNRQIGHGFEVR